MGELKIRMGVSRIKNYFRNLEHINLFFNDSFINVDELWVTHIQSDH